MNSYMKEYQVNNKATFKKYGDWEMPSLYSSIEDEYKTCREGVGLFDMSHLTQIAISGDDAAEWLNKICTGNIYSLSVVKILNTSVCDQNGKLIAIVWILQEEDKFLLISDAQQKSKLIEWFNSNKSGKVNIEDATGTKSVFTLIGPEAVNVMKELASEDVVGLPYCGFEQKQIEGIDVIVSRYGYTGEYEYKIFVDNDRVKNLWNIILEKGQQSNIKVCGLDVMDLLMLEMKSINHNLDLSNDITILQAGLHWMIQFRKDEFIGKSSIEQERDKGLLKKLVCYIVEKGSSVNKENVASRDGKAVGKVIHADFSFTLGKEIGLVLLDEAVAWVGQEFSVKTEKGDDALIRTVSAPLFITKTVSSARY